MLGYTVNDIEDMIYGIESSMLLINSDENPAIHRYLANSVDLLQGLLAEGHVS